MRRITAVYARTYGETMTYRGWARTKWGARRKLRQTLDLAREPGVLVEYKEERT